MTMKIVRYRTEQTRVGAIVKEGDKFLHLLMIDNPIKVTKVAKAERRYMTEIDYKESRFKRIARRCVKNWHGGMRNVSKQVREALR